MPMKPSAALPLAVPDSIPDLQPRDHGRPSVQHRADALLARAHRITAAAYPLPAGAAYLCGAGEQVTHAISRPWFAMQRLRTGSTYTAAVCGAVTRYASQWPAWPRAGEFPPQECPDCLWYVAVETGDLAGAHEKLLPAGRDLDVLGRLMPDPLVAYNAAGHLLGLAGEPDDLPTRVIQALADITRHQPVILMAEACAEGECDHYPPGADLEDGGPYECAAPDAAVACGACSTRCGPWAGEYEGSFDLVIPAPCAVLTALALRAEAEAETQQGRVS